MSWNYDIAKMMKNIKEQQNTGIDMYTGKIVKKNPLTVSILDGEILIFGNRLLLCKTLNEQLSELENKCCSIIGKEVAVIGNQYFFCISLL